VSFKFTWTGLIFLVVVLGIVAALVIPSYADYTHRSQASEAVSLLGGAKTPLAEYFANEKKWPGKLEEVAGSMSGKYTQSVAITKAVSASGEIELTAIMKSEGVDRRVRGAKIRMFSTDGGKTWTCRGERERQNILPAACRG
jgi:type IV pilus assembly protein PilA